jgi:hypothetical protein
VTETGDVLRRDPAVERQIKEQEQAVLEDLSRRGIDPNSTAGRRALNDFRQSATETRFRVSESLKTTGVQRRVAAAQGVIGIQQAAQQATSTSISQAAGAQGLRAERIRRLGELAGVISAPVQTGLIANEEERLRRQENLQRAGVALDASQLQKQAFQGGLAAQADLVRLQELPAQFRSRILEGRELAAGRFERLGAQKFSGNTRRLLEEGSISPFTRTQAQARLNVPVTSLAGTPGGQAQFRVGPNGELILSGAPPVTGTTAVNRRILTNSLRV